MTSAPGNHHEATRRSSFFRAYLRTPGAIGAPVPSSPQLAAAMTDWIDWAEVRAVAEFGAGTGAMTPTVLAAAPAGCTVILIEQNEAFADVLRSRFPDLRIVNDSVEHARRHCEEAGVERLDAVISSLPWASLSPDVSRRCIAGLRSALRPDGYFATYAQLPGLLLPGGRRLKALLPTIFDRVDRSPIVWRNTPPAFVYRCRGLKPE